MGTQQTPYIGSKISLISKLDIRYEGILYTVDSKESTIALSKVRSFGTEDRNAAHVVPPQDEVYDYIIFKANDIKDLIVCETPKPAAPGLPYDPAILSVSQPPEKPAPIVVGGERPVSVNDTRSSTPHNNRPPSQQRQQGWQGNDNRPNYSTYRQGNYQNRYNQNRQQHGYENNRYDNKPQNRNFQNRNNYNNLNNRGGSRIQTRGGSSRPHGPRNNLKFDSDYDFEKAYEQFKETLESIVGDVKNCTIEDDATNSDSGSVKAGGENEIFYDKKKSFFDNISCEALEKEEGKNTRPDWRKERLTNQETFGQQSVRSYGYRRGGRFASYQNNRGNPRFQSRGGNNRPQGPRNNKP